MADHDEYVKQLHPELEAIVKAELTAGNSIAESWSGWGLGVLLKLPFLRRHQESEHAKYRELNDPHYWKAEYFCRELNQLVGCRF